jgi:hypothetical protein
MSRVSYATGSGAVITVHPQTDEERAQRMSPRVTWEFHSDPTPRPEHYVTVHLQTDEGFDEFVEAFWQDLLGGKQ